MLCSLHVSCYRHCAIVAALKCALRLVATGLAHVCHQNGVPLIVDEAHGSHFAFDLAFPQVFSPSYITSACMHDKSLGRTRVF